ncbi:DNA mismatch endonuclease Vsr [Phyllobacterium sp. P30BS-XVII]|uniref:very short patch repair endonuclease n=1 Tax=Phyllobacterium sp. P30BS-XVII TaxID=2587046 RepID=UPI0015FDF7A9|nr:DNA mismatch endonuclease Vsr [Phyllobacterium sp. P30BS-XVII]
MVDTLSPEGRSERMSRIRSKDTKPELGLRKALHATGLRFRLDNRTLPGKPDLVLPRHRSVIFVHGCFWHRHPSCKVATTPKSNTDFWLDKFQRNVARDAKVTQQLKDLGWRVFVAWECELGSKAARQSKALHLADEIRGGHTLLVNI